MSPVGSDAVLALVWQASLILAVLAVLIAFGLVVKRWLEAREQARQALRRERISRLVHALLASTVEISPRTVPPLDPGDTPALFSVALDILRVTRGRDADRMLALLEVWNLRAYLARVLVGRQRSLQIRALTLLARFRDPESLALLLKHLSHPAIYVQLAALRGVADGGDPGQLPVVVRALARSRETNVPMLAEILRRFGEPAVPGLVGLARSTEAAEGVRTAAIMALGSIGALSALEPLLVLSGEGELALRAHALTSLAKLGDPRAEPAVLRGLDDAGERARAAAARAAGLLGLRAALPRLAEALLEDPAWEVRYRVAEALYQLGAPGVAVLRASAAAEGPGAEMARELLAEKEGIPA